MNIKIHKSLTKNKKYQKIKKTSTKNIKKFKNHEQKIPEIQKS